MTLTDPDPRPRRPTRSPAALLRELRARGWLLPVVVGIATAVTLIQGVLGREPAVAADPLAPDVEQTPSQAPRPPEASPEVLENLRPGLEKTPLSYLADYWLQLGAVARPKLTRIGSAGWPAIVLLRGLVLAPLAAAEELLAERARSDDADPVTPPPGPQLLGIDTDMGVALFRVPGPEAATAFAAADAEAQAPGSLLAAVSLAPGGGLRVVPGHLASTQPLRDGERGDLDAALALPAGLPIAALVDLDGALVGVSVTDRNGTRLWSYPAVARVVARLASDPVCQSLESEALEPAIAERLGVSAGVLIARVRAEAYRPTPSIRPGDVLLEWNGEPVADPAALERLYRETAPGTRVRFRALRGRRQVTGVTRMPGPGCRPVEEPAQELASLGLELQWGQAPELAGAEGPAGWQVVRVVPGGAGERAGLRAGDWIVAVDGRSLAERSLTALRGIGPEAQAVLTVRRDDQVRLVLAGAAAG